jgi:hypothetical protein
MPESDFVSPYSWLIAPGDRLPVASGTPTRGTTWQTVVEPVVVESVTINSENKQLLYGQWIAQLVKCQTGIDLVELYQTGGATPPITLRSDALNVLEDYFTSYST